MPIIVVDDLQIPFPLTRPLPDAAFGLRLPERELLADPLGALRRVVEGGAGGPDRSWRAAQSALLPARRALSYRRRDAAVASLVLREAWAGCLQQERSTARLPSQVAKC